MRTVRCLGITDAQRVRLADNRQGSRDRYPAFESFPLGSGYCVPGVTAGGDNAVLGEPGSNFTTRETLIEGGPFFRNSSAGTVTGGGWKSVPEFGAEGMNAGHGLGALLRCRWRGPGQ